MYKRQVLPFAPDAALARQADWHFDVEAAGRELCAHFGTSSLAGFGADALRPAIAAAGALLRYAQATQARALPHLQALIVERDATFLGIDTATRHNLEPVSYTHLVPTRMGVTATLFCVFIGGARALQAWRRSQDSNRIRLAEKQFVQIPEMIRIANGAFQRECIWLGSGFHWTDIEASRMHSLIGRGIAAQMGKELLHKDCLLYTSRCV